MSSSSVCQGLQSCLEPREMEPRVLRLKLALQQGSNFPQPSPNTVSLSPFSHSLEKPLTDNECDKSDTKSDVAGGWSFLQALSHIHTCESSNKTDDQVYVHPTVKRSSSILSEKSLEMCTESLGCETGSNASESGDDVSLFSLDTNTSSTTHNNTTTTITHANCDFTRVDRTCNFPPPLTTITGYGGLHVRPRREGGRLILEAVASPSPRPYFHAERTGGRLRLSLFKSSSALNSDDDEVGDVGGGVYEKEEEKSENEKNREEEEEEDDDEKECVENVEDEMGVKKFARPSRCMESGKRDIFGDALANLSFPRFLSVSVSE